MKKFLLFIVMTVLASIDASAAQVSFGSKGSWYEISADGKTATVHVAEDHDLGRDNASVYSQLAGVTNLIFDSTSKLCSTDIDSKQLNQISGLKTLDLTGATLTGGSSSYYFGGYSTVETLILEGVTADKKIEVKNNSALKVALITPTSSTDVEFTENNSDLGVIKNSNVNTSATFKWEGSYSTFDTYDQDFTLNATNATGKVKLTISGNMSAEDALNVSALSSVSSEIRLLDMSGVTLTDDPDKYEFPFGKNSSLRSVVLPKNLPDAKASWFEGCSNLYAAYTYDSGNTAFKAYVNTPGRLKTTILDAIKGGNTDMFTDRSYIEGSLSASQLQSTVTSIKLSGTLNAVDISCDDSEIVKINSNGNIGYENESTESLTDTRTVTGGIVGCPFYSNDNVKTLDLSDAYFPVYTDMTLSAAGYANCKLNKVLLPTDSRMNTIPAFMFKGQFMNLFEICIPSNYEVIKTCAFAKSAWGFQHIWTTDASATVKVDNGITTSDGSFYEGYGATEAGKIDSENQPKWGTYTFSGNLKLIESYAFASQTVYIKDVYVLAKETPECHVDAFNVYMYVGQSGFAGNPEGGIVTREAYKNGSTYITMLHYPRDCEAPYIQRYTDMGREYSIATGDVDGKGANIYYPSYSEFLRAYLQGTYGYLWNSMNDTRAYGELVYNPANDNHGWSSEMQAAVNDFVSKYPGTYTDGLKAFSDAIFYDVTLGGNTKPAGMKDYWEVMYGSTPLYPQPKVENIQYNYITWDGTSKKYKYVDGEYVETTESEEGVTYYMREQEQAKINGYPAYDECEDGTFVQDYTYVQNNSGLYARTAHDAGTYSSVTEAKEGVTEYFEKNGDAYTAKIPKVGSGIYVQDGVNKTFTETYNPVNDVTEYYASNAQDAETVSELSLNATYYYPTGNKVKEKKDGNWQLIEGVDVYYVKNADGTFTQENPIFQNGPWYYATGEKAKKRVSTNQFVPGVYTYYESENATVAATPGFSQYGASYYAYKDSEGKYVAVSSVVDGEDTYYWGYSEGSFSDSNSSTTIGLDKQYWYDAEVDVYRNTNEFVPGHYEYYHYNGTYYDKNNSIMSKDYWYDSDEEVDEYLPISTWSPNTFVNYYTLNNGTYSLYTGTFTFSSKYYYVSETSPNYVSASGRAYDANETYYSDQSGTVAASVPFDNTYYIKDVTYTYTAATSETAAADRYSRSYIANSYRAVESGDDLGDIKETRYCPVMVDKIVGMDVVKTNDYRGWHQFVLTGFAANSTHTVTQHRSYLTDKDWWTICLPYDLTYNEMIFFYGGAGVDGKIGTDDDDIPYLSQLVNVVRDMKEGTITLNFSKNLMNHEATQDYDSRVWTISDADDAGAIKRDNKVVLYAGVPYLIRPNIAAENPIRQFDIYGGTETEVDTKFSDGRLALVDNALYQKLKAAENMGGAEQRELMEKNIVTVPGLVAHKGAEGAVADEQTGDNYTYTLMNTELTYPKSAEFDYTFVGSFYKSFIPQYSYYLGWSGKATFFYADVSSSEVVESITLPDGSEKSLYHNLYNTMLWNNNTSLIVPNMLASGVDSNPYNLGKGSHDGKVTQASGSGSTMKPAQWVINGTNDDLHFKSSGAKVFIMEFGASQGGEVTGVQELRTDKTLKTGKVYNMNGVEVGTSLKSLPKGIYIQNGKKIVVK